MKISSAFMDHLNECQTPFVRYMHLAVLTLVISQIVVSNFMDVNDAGKIASNSFEFYGTWLHIITGLIIIPLALIFISVTLRQRGLKYYFPYFFPGHAYQLKRDINQIMRMQLPELSPYGIAAIVQGLGLGALCLVLFSGLLWFVTWQIELSWAANIKEVHEFLTGLIQAFIIGHGGMAILHIFLQSRLQKTG